MGLSIKLLADGILPTTVGVLYTVPGGSQTIVKTIKVVNVGSVTSVNMYVNSGAGDRHIVPSNLVLTSGSMFVSSDTMTLETGDAISGDATVSGTVDYTIFGVENT